MVKSNKIFPFLLVFLSFFFLRSWLLSKTLPFAWDQERDAQVVSKIITQRTPPLIGPRVVGDHGFYLGPYFFYFLLPFYALTSLNPSALIFFILFVSILFFLFTYLSFKKLFNQKIALIFLFLWGVLPLTVNIDRIAWNPLMIPLCFSLLIFLLQKKHQNNNFYFLSLGLILGLSFHLHFQGLFYLIFTLVYLFQSGVKSLRKFLFIFLGFFLSFAPLLIFDFRHQFINSHLFLNFFFSGSSSPHSLFSFLPVWANFVAKLTTINNPIFSIIFWFLLLLFAFTRRKEPFFLASTVLLLLTPIAFAIYGRRPSEYYFVYLLPIIISIISLFLSRIKIHPLIAILIILISTFLSSKQIKTDPLSLYYKDQIVKIAKDIIKDNDVYISYNVPLGQNTGFDYLIDYYQINRSLDTSRPGVQFLIPKNTSLPSAGNISLFVPKL